jgi:DNA (cytosine-5)-methyltransferase 1
MFDRNHSPIRHQSTLKVGSAKGAPRVWLEGKYLESAGFAPGSRFTLVETANGIRLRLEEMGTRLVSRHTRKSGELPVVDLNSRDALGRLADLERVAVAVYDHEIVITPERVAQRRADRELNNKSVSLFAGGGLLSEAARQAGFTCVAANEISADYASIHAVNHPEAIMLNCSIEQADLHEVAKAVGPIGLLDLGIPCEPFSTARRSGKRGPVPEAHDLGDMTFWALRAVDILNPHTVVIEEVPAYLESGAGEILKRSLTRMGYTVDGRIFDSADYGMLTSRKRAVIVATTFPEVRWPAPMERNRTLGEILIDVDSEEAEWFDRDTKAWLYNHWENQTAKGNGFAPPVLNADSTSVGCIKKRYFAQQGDNPVVGHPTIPGRNRWLTLGEVKALMGLPADYYLGEAKTTAGEIMGQGVAVGLFGGILRSVFGRPEERPVAPVLEMPAPFYAVQEQAEEAIVNAFEQLDMFA